MVVFNLLAVLFVGSGLGVFWTLAWLGGKLSFDSKFVEPVGILLGMAVAFGLDVLYRWGVPCDEGEERYFSPSKGGAVMFLPIWLVALVGLVIVGGVMVLRVLK